MSDHAFEFLSQIEPFSDIPAANLKSLADRVEAENHSKGAILFKQGVSEIDRIMILRKGAAEVYYIVPEGKKTSLMLKRGDIIGAVSTLMNGGVSLRTVGVTENAAFYSIPAAAFREACNGNEALYEYFADKFSRQMLDESYASIVAESQAVHFLSQTEPFSLLPREEIARVANQLSIVRYTENTKLFTQGHSRLEYLYIIQKGSAERYFEDKNAKILRETLKEGDTYGGISILVNDAVSVRTLVILEDTYFYLLPLHTFQDLCARHESFSDYFTRAFGRRMLDKSYAAYIVESAKPADDHPKLFNMPVSEFTTTDLVFCDRNAPIQEAAAIMSRHGCSSIFIKNSDGEYVGIVTDNDLRKKVIARGYDISKPAADIMTTPLCRIPAQAPVLEALMQMTQKGIKHVAVADAEDKVYGLISEHDLLAAQVQSPSFLVREIGAAGSIAAVKDRQRQLPGMIRQLMNSGANANNLTRLISTVADAALERLIGFALEEMGPPPVRFAFMIMGSEGRREQTLKTDQDNAIIYEDAEGADKEKAEAYFETFAEKVCTWLDEVGYNFCEGGVMAKNPKWRQPLSVWKEYFFKWIRKAEAEDLLQSSIFFDFRGAHGDMALVDELRGFLFDSLQGWVGFFRHLTENALHFKPPLGFFGNFVLESKGKHRDVFDIKSAMMPVVDFARIYALQNGIEETNTLERLNRLYRKKVLTWDNYHEIEQAYTYLMQMRFARQVVAILEENAEPDNYINPKKLTRIQRTMLKEIFKRIENIQGKINFEFIGIM